MDSSQCFQQLQHCFGFCWLHYEIHWLSQINLLDEPRVVFYLYCLPNSTENSCCICLLPRCSLQMLIILHRTLYSTCFQEDFIVFCFFFCSLVSSRLRHTVLLSICFFLLLLICCQFCLYWWKWVAWYKILPDNS